MIYVALLRGINVGGRIIKMAELKDCFESLRLSDARTLLQSGNVIFASGEPASAKLKQKIEDGLTKTFNYPAKVWVLNTDEIEQVVDANPFADASADYHQYVMLFENGLAESFAAEAVETSDEAIQAGQGVVYWKVRKGQTLKSPRGRQSGKAKYRGSTTRNMNTIRKLYELMQSAAT